MGWIGYEYEWIPPKKPWHKTCGYRICQLSFWLSSHTSRYCGATRPRCFALDCSLYSGSQQPTAMWAGNKNQLKANDTGYLVFSALSRALRSSLFVPRAIPYRNFASHLQIMQHMQEITKLGFNTVSIMRFQTYIYVTLELYSCFFSETNNITHIGTKNYNHGTLILQVTPSICITCTKLQS